MTSKEFLISSVRICGTNLNFISIGGGDLLLFSFLLDKRNQMCAVELHV